MAIEGRTQQTHGRMNTHQEMEPDGRTQPAMERAFDPVGKNDERGGGEVKEGETTNNGDFGVMTSIEEFLTSFLL